MINRADGADFWGRIFLRTKNDEEDTAESVKLPQNEGICEKILYFYARLLYDSLEYGLVTEASEFKVKAKGGVLR